MVIPIRCLLARLHLSKAWHLLLRLFLWWQCQTWGPYLCLNATTAKPEWSLWPHHRADSTSVEWHSSASVQTSQGPASHCQEGEHIHLFLHFSLLITRRSFTVGKAQTPTILALHPEHPLEKVICFKMVNSLNLKNQRTSLLRVWQMAGSHS